MLKYTARRLLSAGLLLVLASWLVFAVLHLVPGDPAVLLAGPDPNPTTVAAIREQLGLNQPVPTQYWIWLRDLADGNLGRSFNLGAPIATLIGQRFGNTVELTLAAVLLAATVGSLLGVVLAVSRRPWVRGLLTAVNALAFAVPTYVSGVLFVLLFAVAWRILPAGGHESLLAEPDIGIQYLLMPAVCLALPAGAVLARFLQTGICQALAEDYVRTGVAKGLGDRRLVLRHVLPNALPPVLTVLGIQIGQLLGGAIVVEAIFAWPGLGQLLIQALLSRDYRLVQDLLLLAILAIVLVQTLTEIVQAALDPRTRLSV